MLDEEINSASNSTKIKGIIEQKVGILAQNTEFLMFHLVSPGDIQFLMCVVVLI